MLTIDEAIKHCVEIAECNENQVKDGSWEKGSFTEQRCIECAEEHRQLAEWLKDYKRLLAKESGVDIRCGNCKYNATQEMCGKCYEYSRWESKDEGFN